MDNVFDKLELGIARSAFRTAWCHAADAHSGRYRVGAAIADPLTGTVLASGASHPFGGPHHLASLHAEHAALLDARQHGFDTRGCMCVIVSLNAEQMRPASCSRPCAHCVGELHRAGVSNAVFIAKDTHGVFGVHVEPIRDLHTLARRRDGQRYARSLRLAARGVRLPAGQPLLAA